MISRTLSNKKSPKTQLVWGFSVLVTNALIFNVGFI